MFKKFYDNFEEIFCCSCLGVMIICLTLQVAIRMFTGSSLAWTEELSRYAFIWTVFSGIPLGAKKMSHVRITAQFLPMSLHVRLFFRILADFLWIAFSIFIALQCFPVIEEGFMFPEMSPTLGIKKVWMEFVIPGGFLLSVYRIIEIYVVRLRNGKLLELVESVEG